MFTTYASWRPVFFVNVPVGAATFVFGSVAPCDHIPVHPGRLDVTGLLLSGLGLGSLMCGISEGLSHGWSAAPVLATVGAGVVQIALMVAVELRAANSLIRKSCAPACRQIS